MKRLLKYGLPISALAISAAVVGQGNVRPNPAGQSNVSDSNGQPAETSVTVNGTPVPVTDNGTSVNSDHTTTVQTAGGSQTTSTGPTTTTVTNDGSVSVTVTSNNTNSSSSSTTSVSSTSSSSGSTHSSINVSTNGTGNVSVSN